MTTRRTDTNHKFFKRNCKKCKKLFVPTSKFNYVCDKCLSKNNDWRKNKK